MVNNRNASLDPRGRAAAALALMTGDDFPSEAGALLDALGYASDRTIRDQTGDPAAFLANAPDTQSKRALVAEAGSIRLLRQVADAEVAASAPQSAGGAFDGGASPTAPGFRDGGASPIAPVFRGGVARSFLFLAAELRGERYPRGKYAEFTREINKRFNIPAVVLFLDRRQRLTLAFVGRREHKRDPDRDVLERVSLIQEINPRAPHRAHLDILADLSLDRRLDWMDANRKPANFDGLLDAWLDALDVEALNERFFTQYRDLFEAAVALVQGFADDEVERKRLFVLTLFNRLMFVHFLSRKGWLQFGDGRGEGGEREYLAALWRDYQANRGSVGFYGERLRPLFFAGLNNEQSQDINSEGKPLASLIGSVPFLNGGLFAETPLDERKGVVVPDEAVRPVISELFGRFNFTVMESTPFDVEVAVDPEMLGKVFEELVTGRHSSGAYYTPRPVVAFMCREALKVYLAERVPALGPDDIAAFADDRILTRAVVDQGVAVRDALREAAIVDPACGSGAYLLGMLQELVELMSLLDADALRASDNYLYNLKRRVIERCLHGADKDEFAVNIAMLRLWLSLAVEYDGETPQPLPNLDFKIACGDSLLAPDPNPADYPDLFRRAALEKADALDRAKERHFAAAGKDKQEAERDVRNAKAALAAALETAAPDGVVDWRIEFADVFAKRGGFDIAVANPPYVRQEEIGPVKAQLERMYAPAARGRSDLYSYFYLRALQLLAPGGMHVFICSNSWLDVGYGEPLKAHLLANASVRAVYESAVERQFSTADINTIISVIQKTPPQAGARTRFVSLRAEFDSALANEEMRREIVATSDSGETQAGDLAA